MRIDNSSSLTVTNCTFSENSAKDGPGGGMCIFDGSSLTVTNCTFSGNYSKHWKGGGMYLSGTSTVTVTNCAFSRNYTNSGSGGGMFLAGTSTATVTNCTFSGNDAFTGGGMYIFDGSSLTVTNCTFSGNSASRGGGGMSLQGSNTTLMNCIFWGNTPYEIALRLANPGILTVNYSNIEGGLAGVYVENDHTINWSPDNIDTDPCFANDDFWFDGDYHLKSEVGRWDPNSKSWVTDANTSRCIDAGNPGCPLGDEPNEPNNLRINMGAYGGTAEASKSPENWSLLADLTNNGTVDFVDFVHLSAIFSNESEQLPGDLDRDSDVDLADLLWLTEDWLKTTSWHE